MAVVLVCATTFAHGTVTFSGTSLSNAPGLGSGKLGAYVVQKDGKAFSLASIDAGISLTPGSTFDGIYEIVGTQNTLEPVPSVLNTLPAGITFALDGGINTGDAFGIVVFDSSGATTLAGDGFQLWQDPSWLVPSDGSNVSFVAAPVGGQFQQISTSGTTGTVVPEPSAFATMVGIMALGFAAIRRRG